MFSIHVSDAITLELISYDHSAELYTLIEKDKDYLSRWLTWPDYITCKEDFDGFVKRSLIEYANEESIVFCIVYNGRPVGTAAFIDLQKPLEKGEIGYWITPSAQGNGIATQVSVRLITLGFEKLGLSKVEASVAVDNKPSQSVCTRAGMTVEGVIANVEKIGNQIRSHKKYAIFNV